MRKFLITMMCVIMVVCFMPTVAMAETTSNCSGSCGHVAEIGTTHYDTLKAAIDAVGEDGTETTIKLVGNITDISTVEIGVGKAIILDLNGHTIEAAVRSDNQSKHYYAIDNYGQFTLKDTSIEQTGSITSRGIENLGDGVMTIESGEIIAQDSNGGACIWNEANLIIKGGIFRTYYEGTPSDQYGPACVINQSNLTITGGQFNSVNRRTYAIVSDDGTVKIDPAEGKEVIVSGAHGGLGIDGGIALVNGGFFSSSEYYGLYVSNDGYGIDPMTAAVTVNGGTFSGANYSVWIGSDYNDPVNSTIEINGGTFNKPLNAQECTRDGAIQVKGGIFSSDVKAYTADGYYSLKKANDTYSVGTLGIEGEWGEDKELTEGQTYQLDFSAGNEFVTWHSTDTNKMVIDETTGLATAKAAGQVEVYAELKPDVIGDQPLPASNPEGKFYAGFIIKSKPIYIPPTPSAPTDNVTNSGSTAADNASTNADLSGSTSTSNGTTTAEVDKTTADKIVDKAVENKSTEVVIDATANTTTAANSTTVAQVTIPTETLGAIAEKTEADVTIKTDVAEVKMDNTAAAAVSEQATGDTVQIIAEKVSEKTNKVEFELKVVCSDGKVISNFNGGNIAVTVALPKEMAEKKVVCVYIDDNGHMSKVKGQKNADGTYTFVTGHFSSYAILAEEEVDAAIAAQKEAIKNIEIKLTSKQVKTKSGKKGIKITWTAAAGDKTLDGVEVFRSKERYKGYGTEPFYTSTKGGNEGSYINTKSLKKGTRYYYRVRGYVLVDGQKVYTDYSTKAWRTVK